jgi:tRNAThr (cytosine32-N3)-methyltransferase
VWDLSSKIDLPEGVQEGVVDAVILIFVLSALSPTEWAQAVTNVHRVCSIHLLVLPESCTYVHSDS